MKYTGRDILLGGLLVALAIVIPILFHAVGLGSAFLPMFYPILLAGFLTPVPVALTVGLVSPLASALLTGMPPLFPPVAFVMMAEGAVLSVVPSVLYRKHKINIWLTLAVAVILERIVLLAAVVLSALFLELPRRVLGIFSLIHSLPGVILIFIIVPPLVNELEKRMKALTMIE
jgi:hypothetical protein